MQNPPAAQDPTTPDATDAWHAMDAEAALSRLESAAGGLSPDEAARRLERHGPNALPPPPRRHPVLRFLSQFNNTLIYFLLAASVAAWALSHFVDAGVIVAVVLVNAIVGFIQEGKAEQALDAIRDMIAPKASVLRGGKRVSVAAASLVPGDVVLLEAGDQVPADLRLFRTRALLIDEAILTGESVAAQKRDAAVEADAQLGDRVSMAYSGTLVAAGQGAGVVVATGMDTEIGRISRLIGEVETLTTPLLRQINHFGRLFTAFAITAGALLFVFAVAARGYAWDDALLVVVALAVGVVPEGLPAVITITLAIGVRRMASRRAIIRKLPAVETLGSTSVICSDKTGTLTRNEMTVRRVVTADEEITVEGVGYEPVGAFSSSGARQEALPATAAHLARSGLLCNDAVLTRGQDGHWRSEGDPMEGALVALAMKAGFDQEGERQDWARLDEIPFDAQHRFMASLHAAPDGKAERVVYLKGAPEQVLAMCDRQATAEGDEPLDEAYWAEHVAAAASEGERVLGFAWRPTNGSERSLSMDGVEKGLIFLGIAGFIDPPREEAVAAVAECRSAGISVKMITGDHGVTEEAVSAYRPEVTARMVYQFLADGAAINALARQHRFGLQVVDLGVAHDFAGARGVVDRKVVSGTRNLRREDALTAAERDSAIGHGRALVRALGDQDVLLVGEMGIGNTTSASALCAALLGMAPDAAVGRGTGVGSATLQRKASVVRDALARVRGGGGAVDSRGSGSGATDGDRALTLLAALGGAEIAGLVGVLLEASARRTPVLLDGFTTGVAALVARAIDPHVQDVLFAGHLSAEPAHAAVLEALALEPLLRLGMRLGEGSGAAMALPLLDSAARILTEMRTFEEANIEHPTDPRGAR